MNFKLNALVAAVLMVAAHSASAAIADSNDNTLAVPNNSGDLFFNLVSASNTASYTADLGLTLNQFTAAVAPDAVGIKLVWDLDGGANGTGSFTDLSTTSTGLAGQMQTINYGNIYSIFATADVIGAADLKFDLKAMDGTPSLLAGLGANRYLSTSSASTLALLNTQVFTMDNWDVLVEAANGDLTNSTQGGVILGADYSTAGANMFDAGDAQNVYFEAGGDSWRGGVSFTSTTVVTDELYFYSLVNTSFNGASPALVTPFIGTWEYDVLTSQVTYSSMPVPEAETYAMMLAGLGLVGFMVRRRRTLA